MIKCFLLSFIIFYVRISISNGFKYHHGQDNPKGWDDTWVIYVHPDNHDHLQDIADEYGLKVIGEVRGFPNHFILDISHASDNETIELRSVGIENRMITFGLLSDERIGWAEQQFQKVRVKRNWMQYMTMFQGSWFKRDLDFDMDEKSIPPELLGLWKEEEEFARPSAPAFQAEEDDLFNDDLWDHQWYLHDTRSQPDLPDISLHVVGAWKKNVTGQGVRVVVLDDGLEHDHPDLEQNYDPEISFDLNDDDPDPSPRDEVNSHGTRCAGEIAMVANNKLCGVGVAFNVAIGAVRLLDGKISDHIEAQGLTWALDKVDIYSSSWGPNDDGQTVEGPGRLAQAALERGVSEGRQGRGSIYVWASGNGGSHGDNCNCDGYTASIYTLSVSSASQQGTATWYGESCPSTLTSAFSSGAYTDQKIATTDNGGGCTVSHTGTSAAAPLAAGIIALVLEVRPELTWRDVQYITVLGSDPDPLQHNPGWRTNGVGLAYNPSFGFGVMNAERMVNLASDWSLVPKKAKDCHLAGKFVNKTKMAEEFTLEQRVLKTTKKESESKETSVPGKGGEVLHFKFTVGEAEKRDGIEACSVVQVEHVQVRISIDHPKRGDLDIVLRSPMGTATRLLSPRPKDKSSDGLHNWDLMSVETWGELSKGDWSVFVSDRSHERDRNWDVLECRLLIHGISTQIHLTKRKEDMETFDNRDMLYV